MKRILSLVILSAFALSTLATSAHAQTLGSCKIFPSNNPWNQRIDSLPVHPNSAKYIATVGGSIHLHPDFGSNAAYGIPWVAVGSNQQFVPITITSGWGEEDKGPMPIPANAPVEGGGVGDAHVLVVDTSDHHLYELYQGKKDQSGSGWSATTSAIFGLDSNNYRPDGWTSCDAAGLPIWPGLVRKYECDAGEIKHAIRFTVQKTSKGWIFPARHHAGSTTDTTNVMPMGMRFRLKSTFDDSKFTGNAKVIATAMKRYGIIMADNGSNWFITGETNTKWDDNDIGQLKAIVGNDFEAVYTGPIRTPSNYASFKDTVIPIPGDTIVKSGVPLLIPKSSPIADVFAPADFRIRKWLHNIGDGPLTISSVKLEADSPWHASVMTFPSPIAVGDSVPIDLSIHIEAPGNYDANYVVRSSSGISDSVLLHVHGIAVDGVQNEVGTDHSVTLSPNPTKGNVQIMVDADQSPMQILIYDITGRLVVQMPFAPRSDFSQLPNGVYSVAIATSNGRISRWITVQH